MSSGSAQRYLTVAIEAARSAGRLLAQHVGRPKTIHTKRSPIDLVTDLDRTSEALIAEVLLRHFPSHGFHGEERGPIKPEAAYQWVVDPLDGTMNFVHGLPFFAVSIGLVHRGRPSLGVIYDPMHDELFTAIRGAGATLNGKPIHVSRARPLAAGLLSTGFASAFLTDPSLCLRWFEAFQLRCHGVRRIGSTAVSLAYVACGRFDGFYEREFWPWDIAAGIVLVEEAGGRVTDFSGRSLTRLGSGKIVASNGSIHREMITLLSAQPHRRSSKARTST